MAYTLAKRGDPLPSIIDYDDRFIHRAYWVVKGRRDPLVETAIQIALFPAMDPIRRSLCAFIVRMEHRDPKEKDYKEKKRRDWEEMADFAGVSVPVCQAFEKLFFNVADRLDDEKFIRSLVYPSGRFVELSDDYTKTESIDNMMMRSAYNNGLDALMHWAGGRDLFADVDSGRKFAEAMEAKIMANGAFLASNGYLHGSDIKTIQHAKSIITAAKAGGQEAADENPLPSADNRPLPTEESNASFSM